MKKLTIFSLFLFLSLSTSAQGKYNFNQNVLVHKYIKDGNFQITTLDHGNIKHEYKLKKVAMSTKDIEGNPMYRLEFTHSKDPKKSFILVPDNPYYPLVYARLDLNTRLEYESYQVRMKTKADESDQSRVNKYIVLNGGLIAPVRFLFNGSNSPASTDKLGVWKIVLHTGGGSKFRKKPLYYSILGKSQNGPYQSFEDFAEDNNLSYKPNGLYDADYPEYPGLPKYYEKLEAYQNKLLKEAKEKGYKKLMSEFEEGAYYIYSDFRHAHKPKVCTPIKVMPQKSNGQLQYIKFHTCFTDGKFYDKEKFYVNNKKLSKNGRYQYRAEISSTYELIPFDGRILLWEKYAKVGYVISKSKYDVFAYHLVNENFSLFKATSEEFWKKKNLETEWNYKKDVYQFENFFTKYLAQLK